MGKIFCVRYVKNKITISKKLDLTQIFGNQKNHAEN